MILDSISHIVCEFQKDWLAKKNRPNLATAPLTCAWLPYHALAHVLALHYASTPAVMLSAPKYRPFVLWLSYYPAAHTFPLFQPQIYASNLTFMSDPAHSVVSSRLPLCELGLCPYLLGFRLAPMAERQKTSGA